MIQIQQKQIEELLQEETNRAYTFKQINEIYENSFTVNHQGIYYPYNYRFRDSGWGCAWRAVSALLGTQGITLTFQQLYCKFSKKKNLIAILEEKKRYPHTVIEELVKRNWSPEEIANNWAEPFIASIACLFYNIPNRLVLLNGLAFSYAPAQIFQQTINFKQFHEILKSATTKGSIMIDDGKFALSIIGINLSYEDKVELLFADPHIRCNRQLKSAGVYRKTFDLKGKSIEKQITQEQEQESLYSVYEKLQFQEKCWMICFISQ